MTAKLMVKMCKKNRIIEQNSESVTKGLLKQHTVVFRNSMETKYLGKRF